MTNYISKRNIVRVVSFSLAAAGVLAGVGVYQHARAQKLYTAMEYGYQRSLADLNDSLSAISTHLEKSVYSGTPRRLTHLSANLWRDASVAKTSLANLPINDLHMTSTYKFLSQVGEYAMALSRKTSAGEELTAEEQENLKKLWDYSKGLNESVSEITQDIYNSRTDIGEMSRMIKKLDGKGGDDVPSVISGFQKMEDSFEEYPTLIYDGPFSDHIAQKKSEMLKNKVKIDRNEAKKRASELLGCSVNEIKDESDENSNIKAYDFMYDGDVVSITQNGGMISYILRSRAVDRTKLKNEDAVKKAKSFLNQLGFTAMKESYYETTNNICTVNFALKQDNVTIYPDLIKVSVAMDDGEILSMDARGYILNHIERKITAPTISEEAAKKSVSNKLKIESVSEVIIPTSGLNEAHCYEFVTRGENDEHILVYINAETGAEEEILVLLESEDGVLTK